MKRASVLFLVLLLVLTGCAGKGKTNLISVKDVCCPYEISHENNVVTVTLQDGQQSGVLWRVDVTSEYICQVTQESSKEAYTSRYRLSGKEEGVTMLTFSALQADESVCFELALIVDVDAQGKAVVTSYQHREREEASVEADGLRYKWSVDTDGTLNFSFINEEDNWVVQGDGGAVVELFNNMSTPVGGKFSARFKAAGQVTVSFVGRNTERVIHVVIQADENRNLKVISVQEQ